MKHAQDKILPLVSAFYKNVDLDPGNWITSLWATLYINKRGTVVDVDIPDDRVRGSLRQHLCDEFLKMKGWKPARQDSQPVCATYPYTIRCIRWQD
ncbi:hypothetical protein [Chitinophaga sp. CF418]|uniref:hypothetical protein n=1 Tax=Chitinophaga sp. CF418 TaxID=1855287 RepID=UPI00122D4ACF|nr:hypothetical protein [Chitinophaga sp. CF418]